MPFLTRLAGPSRLPLPLPSVLRPLSTAPLPIPPTGTEALARYPTRRRPSAEYRSFPRSRNPQSRAPTPTPHLRALHTSTPRLHPPPPDPDPSFGLSDLPRSSAPRLGLLLLSLPHPPPTWPARLELASPLIGWLSALPALREKGIGVNVIYEGSAGSNHDANPGTKQQEATFPLKKEAEAYPARLVWGDGRVFRFPRLHSGMIDRPASDPDPAWTAAVKYVPRPGPDGTASLGLPAGGAGVGVSADENERQGWEVLVCTHGARDCRCSDRGGALVRALRAQLAPSMQGSTEAQIKITEVAHVGGHKYAPNALVLPSFDMFSLLHLATSPSNSDPANSDPDSRTTSTPALGSIPAPADPYAPAASSLVDFLRSSRPPSHPIWAHWRGRAALSVPEQADFWDMVRPAPEIAPSAESESLPNPRAMSSPDEVKAGTNEAGAESSPAPTSQELRFRTWAGDERLVSAQVGQTLLQVARANALPAMEGTCGGNLECATCHLYLPPSPGPAPSAAPVAPPSEAEQDMLGYAIDYRPSSRLGCQIKVTEELARWVREGGVIGLPRY